jgi:hypothetical protein
LKTILKLLVAAAVLNAAVHGGMAAWGYFQLKDAAQQTVVFGVNLSTQEIANAIVRRAEELAIPLHPDAVEVTRDGPRTVARASYTQRVQVVPRYEYPVTFSFSVDGMAVVSAAKPYVN